MPLIEINKETDFYKEVKDVEEIRKKSSYNYFSIFFKRKNNLQFQQNIKLLQTLEQSISYINSQFKSSGNPPIDLFIVSVIDEDNNSKNKTQDEGAVFSLLDPKRDMVDPHILISQNYNLGLDKTKVVAQSLLSNLGQEDFAKTVFYHETGHYLDYLLSKGLLMDVNKNQNLLSTGFLDRSDPLYQNFLNSWQQTLMPEKNMMKII